MYAITPSKSVKNCNVNCSIIVLILYDVMPNNLTKKILSNIYLYFNGIIVYSI